MVDGDNKARARRVRTGIASDTDLEVLDGLKEGERVVEGPFRTVSKELKDGDPLEGEHPQGRSQGRRARRGPRPPSAGSPMLIKLEDIRRYYTVGTEVVHALNGVLFEVTKGEWVAIIGQSGSGKSTLMNVLGCLDTPTAGRYWLNGKDVSGMSDNELADIRNREIGFIFQTFQLLPRETALGNVELPLIYRGLRAKERRERARSALDQVGLGEPDDPPAQRAVRRPAAARGHRPGAGDRAVAPARRRAHRQPRLGHRPGDHRPLRAAPPRRATPSAS